MEFLHSAITNNILNAFYRVCNALPFGLETDIYLNALNIELTALGLQTEVHKKLFIEYKTQEVGSITADIVVNKLVLLKVISQEKELEKADEKLVKNQLQLSDLEVSLILNFGIAANHKRVFLSNDYKQRRS
jgi:GxxExxY protein